MDKYIKELEIIEANKFTLTPEQFETDMRLCDKWVVSARDSQHNYIILVVEEKPWRDDEINLLWELHNHYDEVIDHNFKRGYDGVLLQGF